MNTKKITAKNGEKFSINIDDFGEEITVTYHGNEVGTIGLSLFPGEFNHPDHYHITHLALDRCSSLGIGRQCLIFHRECFDACITAGSNDGSRSDDGSHLTGSGPGFIQKMREEGLVAKESGSRWDQYDE